MSERSTFDIGYKTPERVNETIVIDETVSHVDILLPFAEESFTDGMRWVNSVRKALRLHRIDERSMVLSDLSSLRGNHFFEHPPLGAEDGMPHDVMDLFDGEAIIYGRDHNPAGLEILANPQASREHLTIIPRLGTAGIKLSLIDEKSTNGSGLHVVRHTVDTPQLATERLVAV